MIIVILLLNEHILTHFQSSRPLDVNIELHMRRAAAAAHAQCLAQTGAARVLRSAARAIDVVYSLTVSGVWLLEVTYLLLDQRLYFVCVFGRFALENTAWVEVLSPVWGALEGNSLLQTNSNGRENRFAFHANFCHISQKWLSTS